MYGRYGFDELGRFLFAVGFISWLLCIVFRLFIFVGIAWPYRIVSFVNTAVYIFAFFRILSRNIYRRADENNAYLRVRSRALPFLRDKKEKYSDKEHIYKKCPNCSTQLRLKRIKGRHTTRCPKCGQKFKVTVLFGAGVK